MYRSLSCKDWVGILVHKMLFIADWWKRQNLRSMMWAFSFYASDALHAIADYFLFEKSHRNCSLDFTGCLFSGRIRGSVNISDDDHRWFLGVGVFFFFLWCNIVYIYLKRYKKIMCEWKISIRSGLNCSLFLLKHGWKWGHAQPFTDWSWHFACWRSNQPCDWNRPQHSAGNTEGTVLF